MIVFDTSSLVGAVLRHGSIPERALERAIDKGRLALSGPVYEEMVRVLARPKLTRRVEPERRQAVLARLLSAAEWFEPRVAVHDCRDPNDDMYLELALAARAGVIVSSDNDIQVLSPWRDIRILSPAAFLLSF